MDSKSKENLCCPICQDIFRDAVILCCSHSFCNHCVKTWWKEEPTCPCPVCKTLTFGQEALPNLVLRNLCEAVLVEEAQCSAEATEALCSRHSEKLRLFCLDHQQLVCLVCKESEDHCQHTFRPINEAARQKKKDLQEMLKPLKKQLTRCEDTKKEFETLKKHVKVQVGCTEKRIRETFERLHQFLTEEEEVRMSALREEEQRKSLMMERKMEAVSRLIAELSDTIQRGEKQLEAEDMSFLRHSGTVEKRAQCCSLPEPPRVPSGALIEQHQHLGNLTFNVWTKMKDLVSYTLVLLDPNTAHPDLMVSEDLTSVRVGEQQLPDNPERFDDLFCLLSSEGFDSGRHSWDVQVGDSEDWLLGVMKESVHRKGFVNSGFWVLQRLSGKYYALCPPRPVATVFSRETFQRVRVSLDWNEGRLSFTDADTNTHIHTFTHTFTDTLFPYFASEQPLKILPSEVSVSTGTDPHTQEASLVESQRGSATPRLTGRAITRGHQAGAGHNTRA